MRRLVALKPPRRSRSANILLALLLVGCSSSTIETFGCACAGWSVSQEQMAEWREKAPSGDKASLRGLRTYAFWQQSDWPEGSKQWLYWQAEIDLRDQQLIDAEDLPTIWSFNEATLLNIEATDTRDGIVSPRFQQMTRAEKLAAYDAALNRMAGAVERDEEIAKHTPDSKSPMSSVSYITYPRGELNKYRQNRNALARRWGLPERRF